MNRKMSRICILLMVGVVCLGMLAVRFVGESRAATVDNIAPGSPRMSSDAQAANVELVGHFVGGDLSSIVIQGNYAYV